MHEHQTFLIDELNRWSVTEQRFIIRVIAHESAEARAHVLQHQGYLHSPSYEGAVQALKALMGQRQEALEQQLAQLRYNEAHFETFYPPPRNLAAALEAQYVELVEHFQALSRQPGTFSLAGMEVTNDYLCRGDAELFVFTLAHSEATSQTFSLALCAVISRAMAEAGLCVYAEWNGVGCFTWSRKARHEVALTA